jgi:hypothetical protein
MTKWSGSWSESWHLGIRERYVVMSGKPYARSWSEGSQAYAASASESSCPRARSRSGSTSRDCARSRSGYTSGERETSLSGEI